MYLAERLPRHTQSQCPAAGSQVSSRKACASKLVGSSELPRLRIATVNSKENSCHLKADLDLAKEEDEVRPSGD